ncbi:hypothetical protein TrispH2_003121 [Trichoplax sp. H2]|nr:hypothetical protein TrispH2_003121 [Trichoplax sp. H2]|eukprot:RDD45031.1 hypothetical protein TrispH2_003121 [Trichoplax sp. H2]
MNAPVVNTSNTTNNVWYYFSRTFYSSSVLAIGTTIGFTGLLTNSILLVTILMVRKLRKSSRTLTSLSLCGILFAAVFILPIHLLPPQQSMAYLVNYDLLGARCGVLLLININLHQCVLGIERWLAVASPLRYRRYRKSKLVNFTCILLWVTSLILTHLPLAFRCIMTTTASISALAASNELRVKARRIEKISFQVILSSTYLMLLIIMVSSYCSTLASVNSSRRKNLFVCSKPKPKHMSSAKAIRQMTIVTGTFLILCSPALTIIMSPMLGSTHISNYTFTVISFYFLVSYPSAYPILYCYYGRNIKKELQTAAMTRSIRSFNDSKIRDRTTS